MKFKSSFVITILFYGNKLTMLITIHYNVATEQNNGNTY